MLNDKKIKFWKVDVVLNIEEFLKKINLEFDKYNSLKEGTVLQASSKDGLFIKAKNGIISVLEIQGENSKKMNIFDFLRGNKIELFKVFE